MVAAHEDAGRSACRVEIRPNRSLSWKGAQAVVCGIALVSFTIAGAFASLGYWLLLPFAGLEIAALAAGFYLASLRSHEREEIAIDEASVALRRGGRVLHTLFHAPRAWARIHLDPSRYRGHPSRLLLCSQGREVEIGAGLSEVERTRLARLLRDRLQGGFAGMAC